MISAICFKCGEEKANLFAPCKACRARPATNSDLAVSIVLSEHAHSRQELAALAATLRARGQLSLPEDRLQHARGILRDPEARSRLELGIPVRAAASGVRTVAATATPVRATLPPAEELPLEIEESDLLAAPHLPPARPQAPVDRRAEKPKRAAAETALHRNPFFVLGVTTRDRRSRIVERADELSLALNGEDCARAIATLTNPRKRLSAEVAWLPGVAPARAIAMVNGMDETTIGQEAPFLVQANVMAAGFELLDPAVPEDVWRVWIQSMAEVVGSVDPGVAMTAINEDRAIAAFPAVTSIEAVEAEIAERRRYYKDVVLGALGRLPAAKLVEVVTRVVRVTSDADDPVRHFVDELVDGYEVKVHADLEQRAEDVRGIIERTKASGPAGEDAVNGMLDRLDEAVTDWDRIAQPIQLSMENRGQDHEMSHQLAREIRTLGVGLYNDHGLLGCAQRITTLLEEVFAELPEFVEKLGEDSAELERLSQEWQETQRKQKLRATLEDMAENVRSIIGRVRAAAPMGAGSVNPLLDQLGDFVRAWGRLVQPIQATMKARQQEFGMSRELAHEVRSLGVDLHNAHGMLEGAQRITALLQEVFAELPGVAERLKEDAAALEELAQNKEEAERERAEWERSIAFRAELGLVFKDTLAISASGVQWKDRVFPLKSITRLRWGITFHSVNGIPTKTVYTVCFGDAQNLASVETRKEDVFRAFQSRLWTAVGVPLMTEILKGLREGKKYRFGDLLLDDLGAEVTKHRFLSSGLRVYGTWPELDVWNTNGGFGVGLKSDKKAYSILSYLDTDNTHLIEGLFRLKSRNSSPRMSSILG